MKFKPRRTFRLYREDGKNKDSSFIGGLVREHIEIGGVAVYIWLLKGYFDQTRNDGSKTVIDEKLDDMIQDSILMETRDRKYADDAILCRAAFRVSESQLDFARYGQLLATDVLQLEMHKRTVESLCGRRLMPGDVIETPHYRDIGLDGRPMNRYYAVESIIRSPTGWDATYDNHIVAVTARPIKDAQEFIDLMERKDKTGSTIQDQISQRKALENLTGKIQNAAMEQAYTTWWDTTIIYIDPETQKPEKWTDDGLPPNGIPVVNSSSFPPTPAEGDYILRIDMSPRKLYRYQNSKWVLKEVDRKRQWGTYNWTAKLAQFATDQSEEMDARPWEYKSIHDLATPRHNRSEPSPRAASYPPPPTVGTWQPMILVTPPSITTISAESIPITTVTLAGNVLTPTTVHASLDMTAGEYSAVLIQYTAERDTGQQVGEILINDAMTSATMQHEFNDIGIVGLSFTVGVSGGVRYLKYTSTPGNPITLRFRIRDKWNIPDTTVPLPGNTITPTAVHPSLDMIAGQYSAVLIQYTAERDIGQQVGEILINDATTSATMQHEYVGSIGLSFTVGISSGIRYLKYTTTAGNQITFTFRIRDKW